MKLDVNNSIPLPEYPRPQFERKSYLNLNGTWNYFISKSKTLDQKVEGQILVPYPLESELSGVKRILRKDEFLHYVRKFFIPDDFDKGRILLNIGAIDQRSEIYINGKLAGTHNFGYLPLSLDITPFINKKKENEIHIVVADDASSEIYARGKQKYKRGGIWYTPVSGIWQSVFLESVPLNYVKDIKFHIDYDNSEIKFDIEKVGDISNIKIEIIDEDKVVGELNTNSNFTKYHFSSFKSWSCEDPFLYKLKITYLGDEICSYFAMRKFSTLNINGVKLFSLNNKPILLRGVLDQGYFLKGIYTPEKYDDYVIDIKLMKDMGFNLLRKHAKIEPMRFYYECDKNGMIVWQDMVNGGSAYNNLLIITRPILNYQVDDTTYKHLGRSNSKSRDQFVLEVEKTIKHLYNVPSIGGWTIFNEGWGQFDSLAMCGYVRSLDSSRIIDATSGWYDKGAGDCNSHHVYFKKVRLNNDYKRVLTLSEFGGYSLYIKEHAFSKKAFGYKQMKDSSSLTNGIVKLFDNEVKPLIINEGLSCYVYTQLSDVEDEVNGLITYDRKLIKVDQNQIKNINLELEKAFIEKYK